VAEEHVVALGMWRGHLRVTLDCYWKQPWIHYCAARRTIEAGPVIRPRIRHRVHLAGGLHLLLSRGRTAHIIQAQLRPGSPACDAESVVGVAGPVHEPASAFGRFSKPDHAVIGDIGRAMPSGICPTHRSIRLEPVRPS